VEVVTMAESDDGGRRAPGIGDVLRTVQELGGQLSEAARSMADDFGRSPASKFVEPMARLGAQMAELSTMWVSPMRSILEEQQELIDAVAAWAEQQKVLAERFAAIAERHRKLSEQTQALMEPLLQQAERLRQWGGTDESG
jgi:hypothetical protein